MKRLQPILRACRLAMACLLVLAMPGCVHVPVDGNTTETVHGLGRALHPDQGAVTPQGADIEQNLRRN